ncbi:MAG TPA: aminotransferase class V-fold PLP-dependent enzyme [Terriglobia bacterium]|nr:aminotransferase class V-fold PLP-dependent enzyme [Terriglobia bacterium]
MYKHLFPRAREVAYLDTAAEGLPLPAIEQSFSKYYRAKARGTPGREELHAVEAEALRLVARLLGTEPANVAFLASASDALSLLALSIDWKPGDQVIISDLEFPSNVLPWLRLKKEMGLDVVVISSDRGGLCSEQVIERITARTRLISLSSVSYKTGAYLPGIEKIGAAARKVGAVVCMDATQALGRCPVSLEGVDYLVSSSFKWLLGPHGLGIVYIAPEFRQQFQPAGIGWYSVEDLFSESRFESYQLKNGATCLPVGMPNFPSISALRPGIEFLLQAGVNRIDQELTPLVEQLRKGLCDLGVDLLTPEGAEFSSGIVSFAHPRAEEIGAALERQDIIVWAGDGRVRASVHLYNEMSDVDRYLEALKPILKQ